MKRLLLTTLLVLSLCLPCGAMDPFFFNTGHQKEWSFNAQQNDPLDARGKQGNYGTWTYTGANTRSFFNKDAVMEFEADDTKPIYSYVNGVKFFRMEPERINLCLDSRNIDDSSIHWVESGTGTAVQNAIGVDGVANKATTITDSDAGAHYYIIKDNVANKSSSDTNPFCFSVPIKKTVGATTFPAYGIYWSGGTTKTSYYVLNTNTGVIAADVTNTAANISGRCVDTGGDWWRVWVTATDNGGNTKARYILLPAVNADASGTLVPSTQGSAVFDAAQLEYNTKAPTSYVDMDGITLGSDTAVDGGMANSTLDAELWDAAAAIFTAGTYSWVVYGTNTIANDANSLKVTYVDDAGGAYVYLQDAADLSSDLTAGDRYKLTLDVKKNDAGDSFEVGLTGGGLNDFQSVTGTTFDTYTFYFNATHATTNAIRFTNMSAGEIAWIDNLSLKEDTLDDWNEGDYVGHTGSADTVTVTGNQAAEVTLEQGYMDWSKPCWLAEVDPAGRMVVTDGNTITITNLDYDEDCYKLRDMGAADYFDTTSDFTHYLEVEVTAGTSISGINAWALTSVNDDIKDIKDASGDFLALFVNHYNGKVQLLEGYGGTIAGSYSAGVGTTDKRYYTLFNDASEGTYGTLYCYIHADEARTTLLSFGSPNPLSVALHKDHTHDHIGVVSENIGYGGRSISMIIENLSIAKKPTANKVYKISSTATRTAGSYTIEYGSADGTPIALAGTYYDYIVATDDDFLKIKFDSAFAGTVDNITIEEMGEARLSEEAALTFPIPTGVFDGEGTVICWWMPGYNEEDVSNDSSILTLRNTTRYSLVYHSFNDNGLRSYDGTTAADKALAFDAYDLYKLAIVFPSDTNKYKLGADSGSGMEFGAEVAWDGSYLITGTNIIFGYDLTGTTYFSGVDIYPEVLSTQEIDAIRGSPNN